MAAHQGAKFKTESHRDGTQVRNELSLFGHWRFGDLCLSALIGGSNSDT